MGQQLITALQWYGQHADESTGQTSLGLLVLSALILDLDPAAGEAGYVPAGFNLVADVHWGKPHADLRRELELHVMRTCKVSTAAAPLAAHLLLAGTAPEFLVQALPDTLRFRTSIAWMTFKQGVMIAHALAPGSPQYMTYNDMIALAAQPPKTVQQQQWRAYTATRTLLDWAIAQGELPERENGEYLTDEIDALKTRLMHRLQALKDALITVASTPPSRRSIALEDLKRVFPKQPWLEKACLWRPVPPLAGSSLRFPMHHHDRENYSLHSLVELHMDGQLDDNRWASIEPQLDLAQLRLSFGQLGDINERFDTAFGAYIATMKQAYSTTIEDLLAQLPLADRSHLQQADLQLLVLKKPPGKDLALLSKEEELARTARTGVILRATSPTGIEEYELFPLLNRVHKRDGPPLAFRLGGTPISATTGGAHSTHPVTQLLVGDELSVDWEAYANGRPPRLGIRSKVIIDLLWSSTPAPDNSLPSTAFTFDRRSIAPLPTPSCSNTSSSKSTACACRPGARPGTNTCSNAGIGCWPGLKTRPVLVVRHRHHLRRPAPRHRWGLWLFYRLAGPAVSHPTVSYGLAGDLEKNRTAADQTDPTGPLEQRLPQYRAEPAGRYSRPVQAGR